MSRSHAYDCSVDSDWLPSSFTFTIASTIELMIGLLFGSCPCLLITQFFSEPNGSGIEQQEAQAHFTIIDRDPFDCHYSCSTRAVTNGDAGRIRLY